MGKPGKEVYDKFKDKYFEINKKFGLEQYLVPYLMSSHPGSDMKAAIELAEYINTMGYMPEQVQDFYPTPGSLSTTIYYTGINPITGDKVYVPTAQREKNMQRALMQFKNPANHSLVKDALIKANREDLIGFDKRSLIPPNAPKQKKTSTNRSKTNTVEKNIKTNINKDKNTKLNSKKANNK